MLRLIFAATIVVCCAFAQTTSTQMLGTVLDPSGAAIAGANVEATRKATGEKRFTTSNETGNYLLLNR